jgi:hypothetical protein
VHCSSVSSAAQHFPTDKGLHLKKGPVRTQLDSEGSGGAARNDVDTVMGKKTQGGSAMVDKQEGFVFGPEDIVRLKSGFEGAWRALRFAYLRDPEGERAREMQKLLAAALLDSVAREGVDEPSRMASRALARLAPLSADWGEEGAQRFTGRAAERIGQAARSR